MDTAKVPCRNQLRSNCTHLVIPLEVADTDGLCLTCWKEWLKLKYGPGIPHTVRLRQVEIPPRVYELLASCEEWCLLGCCGMNAVELSPERIAGWYAGLLDDARREFQKEFSQLLEFAAANDSPLLFLGDKYTVEEFYQEIHPITMFAEKL